MNKKQYGMGDTSFNAAGKESGVYALVNDFYDRMSTDDRFKTIHTMHPDDLAVSRDKLATFLCGWLGGPKLYSQKYRSIGIPSAHKHLPITELERDQWLTCMQEAIAAQPYEAAFKVYLLEQLAVPAQAVVRVCGAQ